jgi:hypothetical protein
MGHPEKTALGLIAANKELLGQMFNFDSREPR